MTRKARVQRTRASRTVTAAAAALLVALGAGYTAERAEAQQVSPEAPVDLGELDTGRGQAGGAELQIHGFAAAGADSDLSSGESTFDASALAVSAFHTAQQGRVSLFGQLTLHLAEEEPFVIPGEPGADGSDAGGGGETETEIDNLIVNWVASPRHGIDLTLGKFDSPLGLERDDAPLNFQATSSFTFEYGRPTKLSGLMMHDAVSPHFDAYAMLANGWDQDVDTNKNKTAAAYGVFSPSLASHFGLGVISGREGEENLATTAVVGTLLFQRGPRWVVGAELVDGRQDRAEEPGSDEWRGRTVFVHHRFEQSIPRPGTWGVTVRGETFDDVGGVRTGVAQKLTSLTVSPQYLLGGGFFGPFHYLDRTTLPLPQLAVRLDLRWDRSDVAVFDHGGDEVGKTRSTATLQLVYVF